MKHNHLSHHRSKSSLALTASLVLALISPVYAAAIPNPLPDPDGKPADMTQPVQVFIMMGQSNMLNMGKKASLENAVKKEAKYPYLIDAEGNWTERKDVRYTQVMQARGKMKLVNNDWLKVDGKIGVEIAFGNIMGEVVDAPVLLLKSAIGNRSLGWDLLPPGSERFTVDGATYAGYKDHPTAEILPRPGWKYPGKPVSWYAGIQYDDDTANAKKILADLNTYYPDAKAYKIAGFVWWQGDKDRYNAVHAGRYEKNLVQLIKSLRKDFNAPDAKFVLATLGQTEKGAGENEGMVFNAQMAVDGETGKYPEFKGNVATVYSHPLSMGSASNAHYGGNAETYMNVGEGLGKAMVELLEKK